MNTMKLLKPVAVFALLLVSNCFDGLKTDDSVTVTTTKPTTVTETTPVITTTVAPPLSPCGPDWKEYRDQKCFKILGEAMQDFDSAQESCQKLQGNFTAGSSTLPIISSEDEQNFLAKFLFEKNYDNFWIGAKFNNDSQSYEWIDGSKLAYSNWKPGAPRNLKEDFCVEMSADEFARQTLQGKWVDKHCEKKNRVVCQRVQPWSVERIQATVMKEKIEVEKKLENLQESILDERTEVEKKLQILNNSIVEERIEMEEKLDKLKDIILEERLEMEEKLQKLNNSIVLQIIKLEMLNNSIVEERIEMEEKLNKLINSILDERFEMEEKLEKLNSSIVPIGFIYTQLPEQQSPNQIWSWASWEDVSELYNGTFFRVESNNSASFGEIQEESLPRITKIQREFKVTIQNTSLELPPKDWSDFIFTGANSGNGMHLKFYTSEGEVRPRNMAIRIWKRIA